MPARVSVIVPIYNVAAYLEACLDSVAQQTMTDLEVVMVDDGSTDESPAIAERYAARDARFRLVRQANVGLSGARNTGSDHATGEFIVFLDSDDAVPRYAYEVLLGALDRTGSDFASGNVRRLTPFGTLPAAFLGKAFERTRLRTHITRFPPLLADRTAWNKLFRRSFWDRHGFRFPEGAIFEDTPVMLPAHYLAKSVDVVAETVYLWRMREGADLSITQRRTDAKALRDRVSAVDHVSRFLAEQGFKVSKAFYDRSVVGADLRFFLEVLPSADEDYRRLFLDIVNDFLDRADPWALEQRSAINRLKWQLVRKRALPELLDVLRFEDEELAEVPPVREGRHWYADYPYRNDSRLQIARQVYRLDDELAAVAKVNAIRWDGERLRIEGYAYIDMLGAPAPDSQTVEVFARRTGWGVRRLRLQTEQVHRPDVTAQAAQQFASLDWSGFVATLDADQLKRNGRWREGSWTIGVVVRAGGVTRSNWRLEPAPLHPAPAAELSVEGQAHVRAGLNPAGELTVHVQRARSLVRSYALEDGLVRLEGDVGAVGGTELVLHVSRSGGSATLEYPVHVDRFGERPRFLAHIPIADLVRAADSEAAETEQRGEDLVWDLYLAGEGRPARLAIARTPEGTAASDGRELTLQRTRSGHFALVERPFRPVLSGLERPAAGGLTLTGSFRGAPGEYELVLAAYRGPRTHSLPLDYDAQAGRFTAALTPESLRPLEEGLWELLIGRRDGPRETAVNAVLDHGLLRTLPLIAEGGGKRYRVGVLGYELAVLAVERALAPEEQGGFRQRSLRSSLYPARRARGLENVVLYDCFGGRSYSDSPRAVHEELVRREAPYEHLWVVQDGVADLPDTVVPVRELSREYYDAYARARYIVANDHWPRWFVRRPKQVCIQTWHGAPLKRQGRDLAQWHPAFRAYRRFAAQRAENWQYVVSPGPFATPIVERAFPVGGEVLETGLPRTDALVSADRERRADEVRRRLGLDGRRVVLYAPTYRDQLDYRAAFLAGEPRDLPTYRAAAAYRDRYRMGRLLDFEGLHAGLPDDHVVLFRKHPRVVDPLPVDARPFARDVSDFPDLVELLLVADVLVTDYASLLFDFASTGRPIVFFAPDVDDYRDETRGFSLDFEAIAPGPLLHTTEEVVAALNDLGAVRETFRERYDSFVASFCPLADGKAAARLVDRIFRS